MFTVTDVNTKRSFCDELPRARLKIVNNKTMHTFEIYDYTEHIKKNTKWCATTPPSYLLITAFAPLPTPNNTPQSSSLLGDSHTHMQ